jgi:hypothetical protein
MSRVTEGLKDELSETGRFFSVSRTSMGIRSSDLNHHTAVRCGTIPIDLALAFVKSRSAWSMGHEDSTNDLRTLA